MATIRRFSNLTGFSVALIGQWVAMDALRPADLAAGMNRWEFDDGELEVGKLLRPLAVMAVPAEVLKLVSSALRDVLDQATSPTSIFSEAIAAAREGAPAWAVLQLAREPENLRLELRINLMARPEVLASTIADWTMAAPPLPVIVLDLTDSLNARPRGARWADQEGAA